MKWTIFCSAALSVTLAGSAKADWQYTKWGMTPAEVSKASGGRVVNNSQTDQNTDTEIAKLTTPYSTGDFSFTAYFMFSRNTDKMNSVRFNYADGSKCWLLRGELMSKYGQPVNDGWSGMVKATTWQDGANNLRVQIAEIGIAPSICTLVYAPLASANNKGL